jgi:long-chain acyl-CoA synthetase
MLERLEAIYRTSSLVVNCCVHATSDSSQPIIILVPNEANLRDAIKAAIYAGDTTLPPADTGFDGLCKDKEVHRLVFKDLVAVAQRNGFKRREVVQGVVLGAEEWTPQSGLVTAAQKLQRRNIEASFKDQIEVRFFVESSISVNS